MRGVAAYLYGDGRLGAGLSRKCSWETIPVVVSTVTTGKPIWSTQRFMMSWTVPGRTTPLSFTACQTQQSKCSYDMYNVSCIIHIDTDVEC